MLITRQSLGQDVSKVFLARNINGVHSAINGVFSKEMILDGNMLGSVMMLGVSSELQSALVVDVKRC